MDPQAKFYNRVDNGEFAQRWAEKPPKNNGRKKRIIAVAAAVFILVIIVAVVAGVVAGTHGKKSTSSKTGSGSGGSGSGSSGGNGTSPVNQTDPNDPSTFQPDSRLKKSFYGLAYSPEGSIIPACGANLAQVITDIQLLSQLTPRIRLYGADCNVSALVLEAIKQTKVDLTVYLANYNLATDNHAAYQRQRDVIVSAIKTYGTDHISGVTVGNEFMLNYLDDNGATDPNSAVGNTGAAILKADIDDMRTTLKGLGLSKTLPVGTSDAGSYFNTIVLKDVDYGMSNVHPWFANVSIDQAAAWTAEFFLEQNVQPAALLANKPQMYIAETGWPTASDDAGNANNGPSLASIPNLQEFMDTFVCQANTNGTGYFFFEYFDETWKSQQFGGVEGHWGLFNADRTLKAITIPNCPVS